MNIKEYLKSLFVNLPTSPGVYQYFDKNGELIYIGKAKNLRKRVYSYFSKNNDNYKTKILVRRIADIKHIIVNSENDALLLENNLIKKYSPHYNVRLKDDKTYPWIVIKNESFPRVFSTRNVMKDGSEYFGPYTSGYMVKIILDLFKQLFKLRSCNLSLTHENIDKKKFKVCLEYHLKNCKGPCVGEESEENYNGYVEQIRNILKGNINVVVSVLRKKMLEYSNNLDYENAKLIKEKLALLEHYQSKSTIVNPNLSNIDVFSYLDDEKYAFVNYLKVIDGKIISAKSFEIKKKLDESKEDILSMTIAEIKVNEELSVKTSNKIIIPFPIFFKLDGIKFIVPKIGEKKKLLDFSERNLKYYRLDKLKQYANVDPQKHVNRILETMKNDLRLKELPVHIECFDNSNTQGTNPVASCVVFKYAKPSKSDYRKFNIKTVEGPNDFASMEEIVYRRYKRLIDENITLPQLIIIDGGKGQLSSAVKSLKLLDIYGKVAIIGIAKKLEEIYFPEDSIPIYLDKNSESLKVIQKARDEAHRFGITFHRNKRNSAMTISDLNNISGIGENSINKLLTSFKSLKKIRNSSLDELSEIIGKSKAEILWNYLNP
jgi:excinuclease ABC subunit C